VKSDEIMPRIEEGVSLGLTTWTAPNVVAWMKYRRALRTIVEGGKGSIPTEPELPAGT
jgi:hypothetical protein